ncbi:MAG: hypothetical protein ACK5ZG_04365 [Phycisphaerae bacterium]
MPAISVRDASPNGPDKPDSTGPVAAPAALVEARPEPRPDFRTDPVERSLHQAVEQVFLSPRVVDQRAFDEFAGQLSKLTKEAGKAGESLTITHGQVKALSEQLRGLMTDLTTKTDAAIKALPVIEAKAAKVQQLMTHVGNETAIAKARELRDSVAQELLSQRDGLVRQLTTELRDSVMRQVMDSVQTQLREHIALTVTQTVTQIATQAIAEHVSKLPASSVAPAQLDIDSLALDTTLRETITDANAALARFETSVRAVEQRLDATRTGSDQIAQRAEQLEKSLEEAVLRASMKFESTISQSEQRTEAVASEIAEQLLALRADAAKLVTESRELISRERETITVERRAAIDAITAASQHAASTLAQIPATTHEQVQSRLEASSREAADALSQLAAEHATRIEQARIEAVATIQSAAATAQAGVSHRDESMERITTSLVDVETMPLAQDVLAQLQAATQHASQTQSHVSGIITRLESLATRAEEARVQLGERVVAAAQATDVIEQRLASSQTAKPPTTWQQSQPTPQPTLEPTRELIGLLHQAQVTGNQLHQLGAWITHLLQAGEAMAQRLELAQRSSPYAR